MKTRFTSITLLLILLLCPILTACQKSVDSTVGKRILRMDFPGNSGWPGMYTAACNGPGYIITSFLFDTLIWKNDKGYINLLAEDYQIGSSGLTYTFKLRPGITFHDGAPLTAEDVKFTFDYTARHPYPWTATTMVKEVRAEDDLTVSITLHEPYVGFITDVAGNLPILPAHIYNKVDEPALFTQPQAFIGSGPMQFKSYDPISGIYVFAKNPNYFFGQVAVDEVILAQFADSKVALLAGDIDVAGNMKFPVALSFQDKADFAVIEGQSIQVARLFFNFDHELLAVTEIRQAIAHAINREAIIAKVLEGAAIAGTAGFVHPQAPYFNPDVKEYDYDPKKALQLLRTAGIVAGDDGYIEYGGKQLSLDFLVGDKDIRACELIVADLAAIGIDCKVKMMEGNAVKASIAAGDFVLAFNRHGTFGGDPRYMACLATDTAVAMQASVQGGGRWQNAEFDNLFAESLIEHDETKRYELVRRCQKLAAAELPTLALYYPLNAAVYNPQVFTGFYFTPDGIANGIPYIYNKLCFVSGRWQGE